MHNITPNLSKDNPGMPMIEVGHDQYIRNELQKFFPDKTLYFLSDYPLEDESKSPLKLINFSGDWMLTSPTRFRDFHYPKWRHLDQIRKKQAYFVFEIYTESGQGYIPQLYANCKKFDIPTEQTIIIGASYDYKSLSLKFAKQFGVKPVNVFVYNFFERNMKRRLLLDHYKNTYDDYDKNLNLNTLEQKIKLSDIDIKNPLQHEHHDKSYLFLNRVPRPHRCAMLMALYDQNLLDKGHVSFHYAPPYIKQDGSDRQSRWDTLYEYLKNYFQEPISSMMVRGKDILDKLPINLDAMDNWLNPAVQTQDDIVNYIHSSFFSLVTETFYSYNKSGFIFRSWGNRENTFLTEKTYRCMAYKHPFILLTLPKTLDVLKELGYKTFDGIIDESYDKEEDDTLRFLKVLNEVKRLSNLDSETLKDYKKKLIPIVEHNFNVFMNKKEYLKDLRYWGSRSVI